MKIRVFLLLVAMIMTTFISEAQTKKEIRQQKEASELEKTLTLVNSGQFNFVAQRALSSGGKSIDMTSRSNLVEIRDENARGDLAFFGTGGANSAYSSEGGGIKFDAEMMNKDLTINEKKGQISLSFTVKATKEQYTCFFIISRGGSATLTINSNYLSSISYQGSVSAVPADGP